MKNVILTFLFLLLACFVAAQFAFIKETTDLYYFNTTKITSDGGWINTAGNLVQKYNSCGYLEWYKKYELEEYRFSIIDLEVNPDGNALFCGYVLFDSIGINSANFLFKIDIEGNPLWFNIYDFDEIPPDSMSSIGKNSAARNLEKSSHGNYFIDGLVKIDNIPNQFILNINTDGEPIWSNTYFENTWVNRTTTTASGEGLLISNYGSFIPPFVLPYNEHLIYKTNSEGNVIWADTTELSKTLDIIELSDGYLGLATQDSLDFSFTYKIDFEGNLLWQGQSIQGYGNKIFETSNGDFIAISFDENNRMILSEISPNGKVISNTLSTFMRELGVPFNPLRTDIFTDNSLLIPFLSKLIKTDPQLNLTCLDSTISIIDEEYNFSLHSISEVITPTPLPYTIYPKQLIVTDLELEIENMCEEYYFVAEVIDTTICEGKKINFDLGFPGAESFIWNDGSTSSSIEIHSSGIYSVEILHCEYITTKTFNVIDGDCFCVKMPNVFTPDEDGVNDFFNPVYECEIENLDFKIFNRWGEMVFFTNDKKISWDGKHQNQLATSDVYIYTISYKDELGQSQQQKGDVTLLR